LTRFEVLICYTFSAYNVFICVLLTSCKTAGKYKKVVIDSNFGCTKTRTENEPNWHIMSRTRLTLCIKIEIENTPMGSGRLRLVY